LGNRTEDTHRKIETEETKSQETGSDLFCPNSLRLFCPSSAVKIMTFEIYISPIFSPNSRDDALDCVLEADKPEHPEDDLPCGDDQHTQG